jgi:hypothetical protein
MSTNVWAGQEYFRLKIKTNIDFTSYPPTACAIQYRFKGVGTIFEWPALVSAGEEADGVIYHDFSASNPVPAVGQYRVRAKLTISGKLVFTEAADWLVGEF